MCERVKDKVVIVVGAGSIKEGIGNGKAAAVLYAKEGAKVMLVDKNYEAAKDTKERIEKENGECIIFQGDITQAETCKKMAQKCVDEYGQIDVLHNNVGITKAGGILEIEEKDWDKIITVNLKSMFLTCKYVIPYMLEQKNGSIINISSVNSIRSVKNAIAIAYSTSKAGVNAFTREIALQYASEGIRANAVLPGFMETPMVKASLSDSYGSNIETMNKRRASMSPMNKQGEAWDTAKAALFLASDEAKYITGQTLIVDGGYTITGPSFD